MFAGLRSLRQLQTPLTGFSTASRWLSNSTVASAVARSGVDASLKTKASSGAKNEKIVMWKIYATFHRHNTLCSLVAVVEDLDFMKKNEHLTYNEKVLYYMQLPHQVKLHVSAGMLGFRKAHRAEYEAGYQVSSRLFKMIEEKKLFGPNDKVELILRDFGKGREAFTSALQGKEGANVRPHIVRVTDNTKLKFGGSRSKKLRRL